MARDETERIKKALNHKQERNFSIPVKDCLSTGSTLLNLASTGLPNAGIPKGTYCLLAGHTDAGKTILANTILAEACINKRFEEYRMIRADPERGNLINIRKFFGRLADRLEEQYPSTQEEFYYQTDDDIKAGRPFIKVLDSMDSLTAEADQEAFEAKKAGKDVGSYGTAKAKANSANLRVLANKLAESGSILIIIAQLHQNIGFGSQFNPDTISGGKALRYYAHLLYWMTPKGQIKKKVMGKDREQGITVEVKVKKNRLAGWKRSVEFPIYHSSGLDDIGSCVDFLIEEGRWTKDKSGRVHAKSVEFTGSVEQVVQYIRKEGLQTQLRLEVAQVWQEIEEACKVDRDNPYI